MSIPRKEGKGPADRISIPCGTCPSCLARRRSAWAFRLTHHNKESESSCFLTLTYQDTHIPLVEDANGKYHQTLEPRDLTLFFKRLRKALEKHQINLSYYAVGEYGTKTKRPHYHVLFFGIPKELHPLIQEAWKVNNLPLGNIYIGRVSPSSINYVAGYIINKRLDSTIPTTIVNAQFARMSKGIGKSYVEKFSQYHKENMSFQATLPGGVKIPLPRYYVEKIFSPISREHHAQEMRQLIEQKVHAERLECAESGTDYELSVKQRKDQYKSRMITKSKKNKTL